MKIKILESGKEMVFLISRKKVDGIKIQLFNTATTFTR